MHQQAQAQVASPKGALWCPKTTSSLVTSLSHNRAQHSSWPIENSDCLRKDEVHAKDGGALVDADGDDKRPTVAGHLAVHQQRHHEDIRRTVGENQP